MPWWLFFPVAATAVIAGSAISRASDPHDKYALGRTFYGLLGLFWVVLPTLIAYPRRGREAPFTTLFQTLRNLERRLRPLAVVLAWGLVVLVIHLVLYPWPAIIPDLKDLHDTYQRQRPHAAAAAAAGDAALSLRAVTMPRTRVHVPFAACR